jgi:hypothetical protein
MLVTAVMPKTLHYVPPGIAAEPVLLHSFEEHVMGITEFEPDVFAIFTANGYTTHESFMHRLDLRGWAPGQKANVELWFTFPKEARALNGCCAPVDPAGADALAWRTDRSLWFRGWPWHLGHSKLGRRHGVKSASFRPRARRRAPSDGSLRCEFALELGPFRQ